MKSRYQNLDALDLPPVPGSSRVHLVRLLDALVDNYGAEKIIAFGSCVQGCTDEHSDVDLCVVREHPTGCTHPALDASLAIARSGSLLSKDLVVKTPSQISEAHERPIGVMEEVIQNGVTLYER